MKVVVIVLGVVAAVYTSVAVGLLVAIGVAVARDKDDR